MAEWNLIEMLANAMGNAPNTLAKRTHDEFVGGSGGQGYIPSAQASPMGVRQPTIPDSNLPGPQYTKPQYTEQSPNPFPMTGQLRGADNTPGIQSPALSKIDQYLSQLRGPKKPMPGTRPQQFANLPQQGPGSEFFRNY